MDNLYIYHEHRRKGWSITVTAKFDPQTRTFYYSVAACSPGDVFKKKEGVRIAELRRQVYGAIRVETMPPREADLPGRWFRDRAVALANWFELPGCIYTLPPIPTKLKENANQEKN